MVKSFFVSAFVFLCSSLLETTILANFTFLPSIPDISLLCLLFISVNNGRLLGESCGFVSGLFLDFLSAAPFGLNCLYRTLFGFISGLFNKSIRTTGFFVPCLLGFFATLIKFLFLFLISFLFPNSSIRFSIFTWAVLFELICNTFLAPLVFKFLWLFKNSILLKPENIH